MGSGHVLPYIKGFITIHKLQILINYYGQPPSELFVKMA